MKRLLLRPINLFFVIFTLINTVAIKLQSQNDVLEFFGNFDPDNLDENDPKLDIYGEVSPMKWDERKKVFYTDFPETFDFGGFKIGKGSIRVSPLHKSFNFSGEIVWNGIPIRIDIGNFFNLPSTVQSGDFQKKLDDIKTLRKSEIETENKNMTEEISKAEHLAQENFIKRLSSVPAEKANEEYIKDMAEIKKYTEPASALNYINTEIKKAELDNTISEDILKKEKRLTELQQRSVNKGGVLSDPEKTELDQLLKEVGPVKEGLYYYKVKGKPKKGFYIHGTLPFKNLKPFERTNVPGLKDISINDIKVYFDFTQQPLGVGFMEGFFKFIPFPTLEMPRGISIMLGGSITAFNTEAFGLFGFTYVKEIGSFVPTIKMGLPAGWSLGKSIPGVKDTILDFVKLESVNLAVTPLGHIDPQMGKLNSGFNMMATLVPSGPIEKLNKLMGSPFSKYIVSGSVGYNVKDINLKAAVPFTIPFKNSKIKAGSVSINIKGDPLASVLLETDLAVMVTPDPANLLYFGTEFGVEMNSKLGPLIVMSGYMQGEWQNVLGILGINVSNLAISTKFLPEAGIPTTVGITGTLDIAKKRILVGLNLTDDPRDLLILGQLNGEISLNDVVDFTKEVGKRTFDFLKNPRKWPKGALLTAGASATAAGLFLPAAAAGAGISVVFDKIVSRFPIPEKAIPNMSIKDVKILISPFGGVFSGAAIDIKGKLSDQEKKDIEARKKQAQDPKFTAEEQKEFLNDIGKYQKELELKYSENAGIGIKKELQGATGTVQQMYQAGKKASAISKEKLEGGIVFDRFESSGAWDKLSELYGNYFTPPAIGPFEFQHGFTIKGLLTFLKAQAFIDFNVSFEGLWAKSTFSEIKFGPLVISGPGMPEQGEHLKMGPIIDIEVSKNNIGAKIQGYAAMWGMKSLADIKLDGNGLSMLLYGKMFGVLESSLSLQSEGDLDDPDFIVRAKFSDKTYEKITGLATEYAESLVRSASAKSEEILKEIEKIDKQIEEKRKQIELLEKGSSKSMEQPSNSQLITSNYDSDMKFILETINESYEKFVAENSKLASNEINLENNMQTRPLELALYNPFSKENIEINKLKIELQGLQLKKKSLQALENVVSGGSKAAATGIKAGGTIVASGIEKVTGIQKGAAAGLVVGPLGSIVGGAAAIGLQIREFNLEGRLKEIMSGKMPVCIVKTGILGREHTAKFQFDINKPEESIKSIGRGIAKLILGV